MTFMQWIIMFYILGAAAMVVGLLVSIDRERWSPVYWLGVTVFGVLHIYLAYKIGTAVSR